MVLGVAVVAIGGGLYLGDRNAGDAPTEVQSDVIENTTTTTLPQLTTLAPPTTLDLSTTAAPTTAVEPTVP
jgi:hypothetical protein